VYRLSAVYIPISAEKYADRAKQMVRSFRPLTPEERAAIEVNRLRLVRAHEGETIAKLSARTGNVYEVHPTAIANGLSVDAVLAEGQLLKIGVRGPYAPVAESTAAR
jgi:predicted Zn-dependent protease